jgi:hypothetical protein
MCVIVYKPKGISLDAEALQDCYTSNPDGLGYMYQPNGNGRVRICKGMEFGHLVDEVTALEGDVVLHFRLATHGEVNEANCHPFAITHDHDLLGTEECEVRAAIAHNGIMQKWAVRESEWSDTARFVSLHLAHLPRRKRHKAIKKEVKRSSSRFAMMSERGVKLYGDWVEKDEVWYSNDHWQHTFPAWSYTYVPRTSGQTPWEYDAWDDTEQWAMITDDEVEEQLEDAQANKDNSFLTCVSCNKFTCLVDGAYCPECHDHMGRVGSWG